MQRTAAEESGFTMIELVVVILVLGILIAIAVPSYVSLTDRASKSAATTNVRAVVSDVEAYYADNGTFDGISVAVLHNTYDNTVDSRIVDVSSASSGSSFVLCSKSSSFYAYKLGPAALIETGTVAPTGCSL